MKPNYYYITTTVLFIWGLIIGYSICLYLAPKEQGVRQAYFAELSKQEASRQTFYAELSAKKEQSQSEALRVQDSIQRTKILGLRTTIYQVNDLEKATTWYSKAFQGEPYFKEAYYVGFNIDGFELGLQPTEENPSSTKTNVVAYWGVNNIEQQYQRFLDLGAKELEKPKNVGGEVVTATLVDPFGNVIGLIYNPDL